MNPGGKSVLRSAARFVSAVVLLTAAVSATAASCQVNVYDAYQTAKARGWAFYCIPLDLSSGGFVVYPGQNIGCAFRTPPLGPPSSGDAQFFELATAGAALKNGWSIGTVEFSGAQWQRLSNPKARILARAHGMKNRSQTYNFRLDKLVLTKGGGTCSKAIDEAF